MGNYYDPEYANQMVMDIMARLRRLTKIEQFKFKRLRKKLEKNEGLNYNDIQELEVLWDIATYKG